MFSLSSFVLWFNFHFWRYHQFCWISKSWPSTSFAAHSCFQVRFVSFSRPANVASGKDFPWIRWRYVEPFHYYVKFSFLILLRQSTDWLIFILLFWKNGGTDSRYSSAAVRTICLKRKRIKLCTVEDFLAGRSSCLWSWPSRSKPWSFWSGKFQWLRNNQTKHHKNSQWVARTSQVISAAQLL